MSEQEMPAGQGAARLPPPASADRSVLRSIEALDAAETGGPHRQSREKPALVIDVAPDDAKTQARKSAEPVQPLRAAAFRPNVPPAESVRSKSPNWMLRAAAVAALLAGGWVAAGPVMSGLSSSGAPKQAALSPLEELRLELQKTNAELTQMRERLSADTPDYRARQLAELDALKKSLGEVTRRVEQARTAQAAATNDLGARLERARQEDARHREDILGRLARLEKGLTDDRPVATLPAPSGNTTIAPRAAALQPPPPQMATEAQPAKPSPLAGYVLREVYNGVALIEGRQGFVEVYPGATVPGLGKVQQIMRRNGGWVVVTSNGVIAPGFQ